MEGRGDQLTGWDYAMAGLDVLDILPPLKIAKFKILARLKVSSPVAKFTPHQLGRLGEEAVRRVFDIGPKKKIRINGRPRIPDGITKQVLSEVKNVKSLSFSRQLRDYANFAKDNGLKFHLYVRSDTKLSGPLFDAIQKKVIELRYIPE